MAEICLQKGKKKIFEIKKVCRRIRNKKSVISPSPVYLPLEVFIYSLGT